MGIKHIDNILDYVNEQRLNNVISYLGEITKKDFGRILSAFHKDIIDDYVKDFESYKTLEDIEIKLINKKINCNLVEIVRETFLKFI